MSSSPTLGSKWISTYIGFHCRSDIAHTLTTSQLLTHSATLSFNKSATSYSNFLLPVLHQHVLCHVLRPSGPLHSPSVCVPLWFSILNFPVEILSPAPELYILMSVRCHHVHLLLCILITSDCILQLFKKYIYSFIYSFYPAYSYLLPSVSAARLPFAINV